MRLIKDFSVVDDFFEKYLYKNTLSNNYLLKDEYQKNIKSSTLYFDIDDDNLFLYIKKDNFFRLYYFINNTKKPFSFNYDSPIVLEILYRGENNFPFLHQDYWYKSGFSSHISRDCLSLNNNFNDKFQLNNKIEIKKAQNDQQLRFVKNMIDKYLDIYTGDILSIDELIEFSKKDMVFISYIDNCPCGILQSESKNNNFWLGHIVIDLKYRGRGISNVLLEKFLNDGISNHCKSFKLWVIKDNTIAQNLYKKHGFIYTNRSTYSMLKK